MESSRARKSTRERVQGDLQKAVDDLRKAGENASGDVRAGIESAVSRIRDASSAATPADLRAQLDTFRDWLQNATVDLLDEVEKEVRKRRRQLAGQGAGGRSGGGASRRSRGGSRGGGGSKRSGGSSRSSGGGSRSGGSSSGGSSSGSSS